MATCRRKNVLQPQARPRHGRPACTRTPVSQCSADAWVLLRGRPLQRFAASSKGRGPIIRAPRGRIVTEWSQRHQQLKVSHKERRFPAWTDDPDRSACKAVLYERTHHVPGDPRPGQTWHVCAMMEIFDGADRRAAYRNTAATTRAARRRRSGSRGRRGAGALAVRTANEEFYRFCSQSVDHAADLRLPIRGTSHPEFVPAAGVAGSSRCSAATA